jgi:hypothetical protein
MLDLRFATAVALLPRRQQLLGKFCLLKVVCNYSLTILKLTERQPESSGD